MFRKGCLVVCFLLWRLFDCSSTTGSSRQQQAAAGSGRQRQSCNFIYSRVSEVMVFCCFGCVSKRVSGCLFLALEAV